MKYVVLWGIRQGSSIISRDIGEPIECSSREEALKEIADLRSWYNTLGYQIWYAKVQYPSGSVETIY